MKMASLTKEDIRSVIETIKELYVHCNLERDLGVRYFMADSFQPLPVLCHKG